MRIKIPMIVHEEALAGLRWTNFAFRVIGLLCCLLVFFLRVDSDRAMPPIELAAAENYSSKTIFPIGRPHARTIGIFFGIFGIVSNMLATTNWISLLNILQSFWGISESNDAEFDRNFEQWCVLHPQSVSYTHLTHPTILLV